MPWILPVNVETVKAILLDQLDARPRKGGAPLLSAGRNSEVGAVRPPTNGKKHLEVAIALLEEVELLETAVHVVTLIIP